MVYIKPLNEEGYILILVLIVTSILLMLGFTTIKISKINYDMKKLNSQGKKNFYIAEALSEEASIKLNEYIRQSVDYAYENTSKNKTKSNQNNQESVELTYEQANQIFKYSYKEKIKKLKEELENTDNYSIKAIEGYQVLLKADIEEIKDEEKFNIYITSTYQDKKIIERIEKKYKILLPEYMNYEHNKELLEFIEWVNYKW